MFLATSDREHFFPVRGRLCNSAIQTSDDNPCNNKKRLMQQRNITRCNIRTKATATSNSFGYNMKVLPSRSQPARKKDTPMATQIPTLTSQIKPLQHAKSKKLKHHKSYREGASKIQIRNPRRVNKIHNKRNEQLKQMK